MLQINSTSMKEGFKELNIFWAFIMCQALVLIGAQNASVNKK